MSTTPPRPPTLVLRPPPAAWAAALPGTAASISPDPDARALRAALGLPEETAIIMTGHQAQWWHAGVVAKYLAAAALASRRGPSSQPSRAAIAWLCVDHDANAAHAVAYPRGTGASLARGQWAWMPKPRAGVALRAIPPAVPVPPEPRADLLPHVAAGLVAMHQDLSAHAGAASLADQIAHATHARMLATFGPGVAPTSLIPARSLTRTAAWDRIVRALRDDPSGCASAYNEAARAVPAARVRPLRTGELPLWRLAPGSPRAEVTIDDLRAMTEEQVSRDLAPRALLLTALVRSLACDLFIHGLGGEVYDPIMEAWIAGWKGWPWPGRPCAPAVVASATLLMPLDGGDLPTPDEADRAVARAHRARHEPAILGSASLGPASDEVDFVAQKARALAAIRGTRHGSLPRRQAYAHLRDVIEQYRLARAADLARLDDLARAAREAFPRAAIVHDRTWAWPLHHPESLRLLHESITRAFAGGSA